MQTPYGQGLGETKSARSLPHFSFSEFIQLSIAHRVQCFNELYLTLSRRNFTTTNNTVTTYVYKAISLAKKFIKPIQATIRDTIVHSFQCGRVLRTHPNLPTFVFFLRTDHTPKKECEARKKTSLPKEPSFPKLQIVHEI